MSATRTAVACNEMADPGWCIEAALIADIDTYDPTQPVAEVLVAVLGTQTFKDGYTLPKPVHISFRSHNEDDSELSKYEDGQGLPRGSLAGYSCLHPALGYGEIHLNLRADAIIPIHESAHLLVPSETKQTLAEGHGQQWRTAFRALLEELHPGASEAFDRAVTGSAPCTHGSVDDDATHEVYP